MGKSTNPKVLNLDELELDQSDVVIHHDGTDHHMRVLSVNDFIRQQKRQNDHAKLVAQAEEDGVDEEATLADAVTIMRDQIGEFFPTLPVGELATPKLFTIFAWMNDLTAKLNETAAEDVVAEVEGEVGNEETPAE